jgi:hypothetical protein
MIWGEEYAYQDYRTWTTVSVTAKAFGDRISVALGSNNRWPTQNNAVYWDNCTLEQVELSGGECPECPEGTIDYEKIRLIFEQVLQEMVLSWRKIS